MMEARIICTCRSVRISDLGKSLTQGESFTLDEAAARKSADLMQLAQAGAVKISYSKKPDFRPAPSNGYRQVAQRGPNVPQVPSPLDPTMLLFQQLQKQVEALRNDLPALVDKAVAKALAERDRLGKVEEIRLKKRKSKT